MRYRDAKRLHSGDEVIVKAFRCPQYVVEVEVHDKDVLVLCDDGVQYHHREIR